MVSTLKLAAENGLPLCLRHRCFYCTGPGTNITELLTDQPGWPISNYREGSCKLVVKDVCGNLLYDAVSNQPANDEGNGGFSTFDPTQKVVSTVNTCNGLLTTDDRVYSLMENGKGAALMAQAMGKLSVMVPWCSIPENVGLCRGANSCTTFSLPTMWRYWIP